MSNLDSVTGGATPGSPQPIQVDAVQDQLRSAAESIRDTEERIAELLERIRTIESERPQGSSFSDDASYQDALNKHEESLAKLEQQASDLKKTLAEQQARMQKLSEKVAATTNEHRMAADGGVADASTRPAAGRRSS